MKKNCIKEKLMILINIELNKETSNKMSNNKTDLKESL